MDEGEKRRDTVRRRGESGQHALPGMAMSGDAASGSHGLGESGGRPLVLIVAEKESAKLESCLDKVPPPFKIAIAAPRRPVPQRFREQAGVAVYALSPNPVIGRWQLSSLIWQLRPVSVVTVDPPGDEGGRRRRPFLIARDAVPWFAYDGERFHLASQRAVERAHWVLPVYIALLGLIGAWVHAVAGWGGLAVGGSVYVAAQVLCRGLRDRAALHPSRDDKQENGHLAKTSVYETPFPLYLLGDPELGWTHGACADVLRRVTFRGRRSSYRVRTDAAGHRITERRHAHTCSEHSSVAMLGCSYTFGAGVSDDETYPWLVQATLRDWRITNYGCCGYSLYQMLLLLRALLETEGPRVVTVGLHGGLTRRLAWSTAELRDIFATGRKFPTCALRKGGLVQYAPIGYKEIPLSRCDGALAWTQASMNSLRLWAVRRRSSLQKTNEYLLREMKRTAERHGAELLVACLDGCEEYYRFLYANGFKWFVSSVDLCSKTDTSWTLEPFDSHPNQRAHSVWAAEMTEALLAVDSGQHPRPHVESLPRLPLDKEPSEEGPNIYPLY